MHVTKIATNVKGAVEIDLGPRTLIIGRNASHKSGLRAALSLALTGRADDVGALPSELMTLAPPNEKKLYVGLGLDTGARIEWEVTGSTAKATKPTWTTSGGLTNPAGAMLDRVIMDVLRSEPKRQREAFLSVAAPGRVLANARDSVPEAFRADWDKFLDLARERMTADGDDPRIEADVLVRCAEELRKAVRDAKKRAKAVDVPAPSAPNADEVEAIKKSITLGKGLLEAFARRAGAEVRLERLRAERERAVLALAAEGLPDPAVVERTEADFLAINRIRDRIDRTNSPTCPCCGTISFGPRLADDKTFIEAGEVLRANGAEVVRVRGLLSSVAGARPVAEIDQEIAEANTIVTEAAKALAAVPEGKTSTDVAARVTELESSLVTAENARRELAAWDENRRAAVAAEGRATTLGALTKAADRQVTEALGRAVSEFEARANLALRGRSLSIQLFDGHRPVCRVGLDGKPWRALSGAERASCVSALACAWAVRESAPVKLVTVDDVWLDRENLGRLCEGLGATVGVQGGPTQAIICAVAEDGAQWRAPEGWTLVDLRSQEPVTTPSKTAEAPF